MYFGKKKWEYTSTVQYTCRTKSAIWKANTDSRFYGYLLDIPPEYFIFIPGTRKYVRRRFAVCVHYVSFSENLNHVYNAILCLCTICILFNNVVIIKGLLLENISIYYPFLSKNVRTWYRDINTNLDHFFP